MANTMTNTRKMEWARKEYEKKVHDVSGRYTPVKIRDLCRARAKRVGVSPGEYMNLMFAVILQKQRNLTNAQALEQTEGRLWANS